jgi:hypothetical protein
MVEISIKLSVIKRYLYFQAGLIIGVGIVALCELALCTS